jgi:hypothetical protein
MTRLHRITRALAALLAVALPAAVGLAADPAAAGRQLCILQEDGAVAVKQGDQLLLRYRYQGAGRKPYVAELTAPGGANVLRDAPADHRHHHGLMFACRVNGVNFWEEPADGGRQVHAAWVALRVVPGEKGTPERAVLHERLQWRGPGGQALLDEERVISVPAARPGEPRLLTWQTALTAPARGQPLTLTGADYHGLGARFPAALRNCPPLSIAAGGRGVAGTLGRRAAWCAYTAEVRPGKPVTVVLCDAPKNPRHPTRWYTKDDTFAYLSASLGADTEPVKLRPGETLTLRYGVVVLDGAAAGEAIGAAYEGWAASAGDR